MRFNPDREIPAPKSHLDEYPFVTIIAIPDRIRVFGTDLRAIVVFNNQKDSYSQYRGIGWGNDGIYLYRMNNDLHISYVKFDGAQFILIKEFKPKEVMPYDEASFGIIGRIRAVLKKV